MNRRSVFKVIPALAAGTVISPLTTEGSKPSSAVSTRNYEIEIAGLKSQIALLERGIPRFEHSPPPPGIVARDGLMDEPTARDLIERIILLSRNGFDMSQILNTFLDPGFIITANLLQWTDPDRWYRRSYKLRD